LKLISYINISLNCKYLFHLL